MENQNDMKVFLCGIFSLIPVLGVLFALLGLFLYRNSSKEGLANTGQMLCLFIIWIYFVASIVVIYHNATVLQPKIDEIASNESSEDEDPFNLKDRKGIEKFRQDLSSDDYYNTAIKIISVKSTIV